MNKQQAAFEKLSKLKVGALFMEMGTGKTKVALDLIASKKDKVGLIIWICPFSLKGEIEAERQKWHAELILTVVGCESIGQSDKCYLELLEAVKTHNTFIVVDESLKIKNKDAKRTKRILMLGQYAAYKLILNGTPITKNVLDLWTQMEFLSPKILNMSYRQFKNTYTEYYLHGRLKGFVKKQYNIEHLISLIQPYIFDSELSINSKKRYFDYFYRLENVEKYNCIKQAFIGDFENFDFMSMSQALQSCYCKSSEKEKIIKQITSEIDGQIIIFVKFLNSIPTDAKRITGDMKTAERLKVIDDFKQGKIKVLYITYGCGAYGLNLQCCRNIIFSDHTFDYAQRIQAEARIYRMGQKQDVNYYNLWCNTGLEKMIQGSLNKKSNLLDEVKKEIEKVGAEQWLKSI